MGRYVENLMILESAAKVKTITKMLGKGWEVRASFGHIRDLPKSKMGIDIENNYTPQYEIYPEKKKIVRELKSLIGPGTIVWLASDGDAEGEAIAWHLHTTLKSKGVTFKRIEFHEINKPAILHAIANPTVVNMDKVNMQQTRRIIDRVVGYTLSPLLWKKIKYGLSAGRTQSAALRIITDKEKEIDAFTPEEFWNLDLTVLDKPTFKAKLAKIDDKNKKVRTEQEAKAIKDDCDNNTYVLDNISEKDSIRNPAPPFTTSTLQQEASRKLGYAVKQTMNIAQKLYEGNMTIPGHEGGLITYMRTDSFNISDIALKMIKDTVLKEYGNKYSISSPRRYKNKSNNVEAVHEAVRPTNMNLKPSDIQRYVDNTEYRLYSLIWKRTMATQMAIAKVATTTYRILGGSKKQYEYTAKGTKIIFDGFMKAYTEGNDDDNNDSNEKFLPNVKEGTVFKNTQLDMEQKFTQPPSRYSEASLIKKLETEGIGRPSTYATIISTIIFREYVEKSKDKKLVPTVIGKVVSDYLVDKFTNIVDLKFTSKLESDLDLIEQGKLVWTDVIDKFYKKFMKDIDANTDGDRVQYSSAEVLGKDPETGLDVTLRYGQYGSYAQIGESDKEKKIKARVAPIPKGVQASDITLELALHYLKLPRELGMKDDLYVIKAATSRFGPMLTCNGKYYSLKEDDPYTITLERALEIINTKDEEYKKSVIREFNAYSGVALVGRYGPFIKAKSGPKGKWVNHKIPKDVGVEGVKKWSEEDFEDFIKEQPKNKPKPKKSFKKK